MSEKRQPSVLGALPRTRPHRRSDKRPAIAPPLAPSRAAPVAPAAAPKKRAPAPAKPAARDPAAGHPGPLGTAVQAAAELTEIGLKASARALRGALTRLPRR